MVRLLLIILSLNVGIVGATSIEGALQLTAQGKPLLASEGAEAVIYFRPSPTNKPKLAMPSAPKLPVLMTTYRKQFLPRILPIYAGTTVRFPNRDTILHNVFSTTPGQIFDTGIYGMGEGFAHTFVSPGLVKVFCNVHHSMFGYVLVLDTPYFVKPGLDGKFKLDNVPNVAGELVVFHDRGMPIRMPLDLSKNKPVPLSLKLELNRRKVPSHSNKFGKPYGQANSAYQ